MVAAYRNGVKLWHFLGAVDKHIGNNAHGRARRKDILFLCDVFFENIVLNSATQFLEVIAGALCCGNVASERNHRRRVDGHRSGDLFQIYPLENDLHIGK